MEITHALGSYSMLGNRGQRGSKAWAMREEVPAQRPPQSQRGFRNKVPSPTQMSLAEPQPCVPSKVHQRLCMDFLTALDLSSGLAPGAGHKEQTNPEVFLAARAFGLLGFVRLGL